MARIGTLREGPLHASLKQFCRQPTDRVVATVDGYVVDLLRDDLIIEIQTTGFSAITRKMRDLVERHRVRLVHPVPRERWLVKLPKSGRGSPSRRRSPKNGGFEQIFEALVSFPDLIQHENFELEILSTREEEIQMFRPKQARRRRGWTVVERRLLEVSDRLLIRNAHDLLQFLPKDLPDPFHTGELAKALGKPRRFAQKAAYCLRKSGAIAMVGKRGNTLVYSRSRSS